MRILIIVELSLIDCGACPADVPQLPDTERRVALLAGRSDASKESPRHNPHRSRKNLWPSSPRPSRPPSTPDALARQAKSRGRSVLKSELHLPFPPDGSRASYPRTFPDQR